MPKLLYVVPACIRFIIEYLTCLSGSPHRNWKHFFILPCLDLDNVLRHLFIGHGSKLRYEMLL